MDYKYNNLYPIYLSLYETKYLNIRERTEGTLNPHSVLKFKVFLSKGVKESVR